MWLHLFYCIFFCIILSSLIDFHKTIWYSWIKWNCFIRNVQGNKIVCSYGQMSVPIMATSASIALPNALGNVSIKFYWNKCHKWKFQNLKSISRLWKQLVIIIVFIFYRCKYWQVSKTFRWLIMQFTFSLNHCYIYANFIIIHISNKCNFFAPFFAYER